MWQIKILMRIYFYHTQNIQHILSEWQQGKWMGHLLYGATHFKEMGIDVIWHKFIPNGSRLYKILVTAWRVLKLSNKIDAVFATHYQGIELLLILHALGLFRKPIVLWMHQPILRPHNFLHRFVARLLYKGADEMLFFSQKIIDDSVKAEMTNAEKFHIGHWGADLKFYDCLLSEKPQRQGFISSGKEMRDMPTLFKAFAKTNAIIDAYLPSNGGGVDYTKALGDSVFPDNIHLHLDSGLTYPQIAAEVNRHSCVCICCQETNYTVGLTTVVEALALGIPILSTRNPQFPFDIDKEGVGITIPYYDVDSWVKAINYIESHPREAEEMGHKGRLLAERLYNDRQCAEDVTGLLRKHTQKL